MTTNIFYTLYIDKPTTLQYKNAVENLCELSWNPINSTLLLILFLNIILLSDTDRCLYWRQLFDLYIKNEECITDHVASISPLHIGQEMDDIVSSVMEVFIQKIWITVIKRSNGLVVKIFSELKFHVLLTMLLLLITVNRLLFFVYCYLFHQ